ncbi:hypothetical protein F3J44_12095 [Pantoea sp. Tr-811]|uniref:hypothetical protein n=1 Tax=Pantoea sp. Tr-811 TaxID=2608361 RepID=UPI00142364BB|nr:hypothetical protein [Pantoea sp. Tr-811]NIF27108.1 hypothetical protein [Pantoea sp. Tr-811]
MINALREVSLSVFAAAPNTGAYPIKVMPEFVKETSKNSRASVTSCSWTAQVQVAIQMDG